MVAVPGPRTRDAVLETKISVDIDPKGTVTRGRNIRVGSEGSHVVLFVDGKPVPMRTKTAVKLYLDLGKQAEEITRLHHAGLVPIDRGVVLVKLARDQFSMWPEFARRLAGALMRRTDAVDDWQIANPTWRLQ